MRLCWRNAHHAYDRRLGCDIRLNELGEGGGRTEDEVVGEHHGERFMPDGVARHEHSVAEAELLFLTDRHEVHHVGNRSYGSQVFDIAALLKDRLKVRRDVEVIFDRALMFARDKNDPLDPRGDRLFDGVLDGGAINDRQQLLWDSLRRRKEPGAPSGYRENCGADLHRGLRAVLVIRISVTPRGEPIGAAPSQADQGAAVAPHAPLPHLPRIQRGGGVPQSASLPDTPQWSRRDSACR